MESRKKTTLKPVSTFSCPATVCNEKMRKNMLLSLTIRDCLVVMFHSLLLLDRANEPHKIKPPHQSRRETTKTEISRTWHPPFLTLDQLLHKLPF
mmetsp:Transcript_11744/g.24741  ORF Transcript_11744/g.24741 Transcript_11744/m.24741 type:complete len:95 (-) Transcript_11744:1163-1447(-)